MTQMVEGSERVTRRVRQKANWTPSRQLQAGSTFVDSGNRHRFCSASLLFLTISLELCVNGEIPAFCDTLECHVHSLISPSLLAIEASESSSPSTFICHFRLLIMADTIRILVATDNHVGAHERDPHRSDDSWKTFHEIMELARDREVDMVLLAGDLFHENKPSRKSMYNVMRSLRLNSLGARPCELEILSDGSEQFDATFDHVNYEDPDINVSIPVFSIHGNHDDPSGDGHYAALDILAMSGLVNYFGRTPESDKINVKPVLLQKGSTKLALYGLSNVRDERLWRTFKDEGVTFFQPGTQSSDWYHMICVHQNHYAHTETNYLPENVLPSFLDLVIWGHEHECLIQPKLNPEMNFHVIQPGSSVATSLIPGEAIPKHVTILSITGRELKNEPIRLRTVRPFVYKDIVLAQDPVAVKIGKAGDHRTKLTSHLISIVEDMIAEAEAEWTESQENAGIDPEAEKFPLPLIRLRVEYTSANGLTKFEVENPQRFSNRFQGRVANTNDVIQYHIKKRSAAGSAAARTKADTEAEAAILNRVNGANVRVEKLVKEFLEAQSLTILPTTVFGDAVNNFVDKDDKHALNDFVKHSLERQVKALNGQQDDDESDDEGADLMAQIEQIKESLEAEFAEGLAKSGTSQKFKPKPDSWDTDEDGNWEDQPGALIRNARSHSADVDDSDEDGTPAPTTRGRGRGRGRGARGTTSTRARGKTARARTSTRGRKTVSDDNEDEDDNDDDIDMPDVVDDDEDSDSQAMFVRDNKKTSRTTNGTARTTKAAATGSRAAASTTKAATARKTPARGAAASKTGIGTAGKQSTLNFSASQASVLGRGSRSSGYVDVEEIDDDSDGFEEMSQPVRRRR
jgi:double-strand break repair protein MRE11